MNFKTTLLLLVLTAGGAGLFFFQDAIAERLGYAPKDPGANSPTLQIIGPAFRPDRLVRIEIAPDGGRVVLVRGKGWSLDGGWPARTPEVQEVVDLLAGLGSRFAPIANAADLHA